MSHQLSAENLNDYIIYDTLASSIVDGKRLKMRIFGFTTQTPSIIYTVNYTTVNALNENINATKDFTDLTEAVNFYNLH